MMAHPNRKTGDRAHPHMPDTVGLEECAYRDEDVALLEVMRYFFVSFTDPERQAWETAFQCSEIYFGPQRGGEVALALLRMIQTMRVSRRTTFRFSNPYCSSCRLRVTDCERHMLGAFRDLSAKNTASARAKALMLCEGFPAGEFLNAAAALVATQPHLAPARGAS